ncbi:putative transposase Ptta/En/Spm plant [Arabidopsis thaliana x Arabidopsis arenosa]|uniref:Putative transposase Ptta/En/Spm plant n=1 Tax=Arabidopsis thaliana x Arabidopsis arenosa TaxID=1240361 RepID=A0A8T1Z0D3_9BRAS|nr:putative transposase Ptta/En/Spm plant [Arabidopsis thaliana x Arabidopsis arenosa]
MYNWDKSINERIRAEFEDKLKDRMCDQVSRRKGKWKNKGDEAKPKWIDPIVWAGLVRFWRDHRSEIKSINSRNARYHDPDGHGIYKHRYGQTSFKSRARKHFEETGDSTPDFLVVLEQTHRKPDGTFIDRKSEEIYKEVSSRIEEEESQLCSGDNTESYASGGLSVPAKNKIYTQEGCMGLVLCSMKHPLGPPLATDDPVVLSEKLATAEARLQSQAEKIHSFDAYFEYLAEKDPVFAGIEGRWSSQNVRGKVVLAKFARELQVLMFIKPSLLWPCFFKASEIRDRNRSGLPASHIPLDLLTSLLLEAVKEESLASKRWSSFNSEISLSTLSRSTDPRTLVILVEQLSHRYSQTSLTSLCSLLRLGPNPFTKPLSVKLMRQRSRSSSAPMKKLTAEGFDLILLMTSAHGLGPRWQRIKKK